jgi:hypothetical protein
MAAGARTATHRLLRGILLLALRRISAGSLDILFAFSDLYEYETQVSPVARLRHPEHALVFLDLPAEDLTPEVRDQPRVVAVDDDLTQHGSHAWTLLGARARPRCPGLALGRPGREREQASVAIVSSNLWILPVPESPSATTGCDRDQGHATGSVTLLTG